MVAVMLPWKKWRIFICRSHGSRTAGNERHAKVTNARDEQIGKLAEQIYIVCVL